MSPEEPDSQRDLRVTVELGVVLPVTKDGFGNVKPRIVLSGLDPFGDVDRQISAGLETAVKAFARIDGSLDQVLSEILAPVTGQPGFKDRLEINEKDVRTAKGNIRRIADKVKSMDAEITAALTKLGLERASTKKEPPGGSS